MARQMEPLQRFEGLVTVLVDENAWVAGFLPHILDLQLVPGGISGDEDPSPQGMREHADAAGGVAGQVHQNDGVVAEEVVRSGEGQRPAARPGRSRRGAVTQRIAHPAHRRDRTGTHPFVFSPVQVNGKTGQVQQPADVIPVRMRR